MDPSPQLLARELTAALPPGTVDFNAAARGLYASDASNFRQPPIGVVYPTNSDDVVAIHAICRSHHAPVLPRGCGTSLAGQAVNHAVVIDCSRHLTRVLGIDHATRTARAEPGAINAHVTQAAAAYGLRFGPDPATRHYCTIGGNVGNNSCGVHSLQARFDGDGSRTSDNIAALEVLTYDGVRLRVGPTPEDEWEAAIRAGGRRGEIYAQLKALRDRCAPLIRERFPHLPRRVSGYNLDDLLPERGGNLAAALTGTEGTCVTVLEATLKLIPQVPYQALLVVGYEDLPGVARHLETILDRRPIGCECFDSRIVRGSQHLPPGEAWVLVELGGASQEEADGRADDLARQLRADPHPPAGTERASAEQAEQVWAMREAGLATAAFPPGKPDCWPGWEDAAVPPERMGDYLRDFLALKDRHCLEGALYGHLGDGCIHTRLSFDLATPQGTATYRAFMEDAADLVCAHGGSLSGEHGDGHQRAELLARMFGEELVAAFREFKTIWDPEGGMNPGKVVDPYPLDTHLRLTGAPTGASTGTLVPLHFAYPEDGGSFAHATLRCVGIGRCRQPDGAEVICPSFKATGEEMHSTRGRTHLLNEMLRGEVVSGGWRSEEVKEALDLCLACKGCTSDCPVHVDVPTYKAEFLARYWKGRVRPRSAYVLGRIDRLARVAARMPAAANLFARLPGLRVAAGLAPERAVPRFSRVSLHRWFARRSTPNPSGPRVVLWPDTFTNFFDAEIGIAAVEFLEAAGWQVVLPEGPVCCGRPLYDYGFLDLAERYLQACLAAVRDDLAAGTPIVGLEPSCIATLRHELPRMLPGNPEAHALSQRAQHFAEFLEAHGIALPAGPRREALLWGHCHQRATGGLDADQRVLEALGVHVQRVAGGCCGLAGSWGFETEHYGLSMACGEQALLPAVRRAAPGTLVVANGFSCRTQIDHAVPGRQPLHLAQVIALSRRPSRRPGSNSQ